MIVMVKADQAILSLFQRKEWLTDTECREFIESYIPDMRVSSKRIDQSFKHSQYTIVKHHDKTYVLYNTLYNSMLTMSNAEYEQYSTLVFSDLNLVGTLADHGFLIPDYTDEFEKYCHYKAAIGRWFEMPAHYTVVLTTRCNARCFYCYEDGIPFRDMTEETAKRFADLLLRSQKEIEITWFGGEPLMQSNRIDDICHILRENDVPFKSNMITNGSLLTEELICTKFPEWNVNGIQITLDGMKEEYAKRKCYLHNGENMFDKIIENIRRLLIHGIAVSVRLNIDGHNANECVNVAKYLKVCFPDDGNLDVYPAFLVGNNSLTISERQKIASTIYKLYEPSLHLLYEIPSICPCLYRQPGAFVIDADGSVLCCDRDVGKQMTKIGHVDEWQNFDQVKKSENNYSQLRHQCISCVYYPKCGGGCEADYNAGTSYDACFMHRYQTEYLLNKIMGIN